MLESLCNVILAADDVALAEREAAKLGPIYQDASFKMSRKPRLLRQEVQYLLQRHGKQTQSTCHRWSLDIPCRVQD